MEEKSLSWWGDVTTGNKEEVISKNKEIIGERLELFRTIKGILEDADIAYFIEGGTLLGAYRNGQFIYHDNDIDIGCVHKEFVKVREVLDRNLPNIYTYNQRTEVGGYLTNAFGCFPKDGEKYVDAYGQEWPLNMLDIYNYIYSEEEKAYRLDHDRAGRDAKGNPKWIPEDLIFPLGTIMFEGIKCPCPNRPKEFAEIEQGYLGEDFEFDQETQLFIKRRS
ncbi:MAG: LicD family protein [Deltaproteobacteria bacterium]|nr:LicD family protein [Deltaproteobacteria bacterium]